VVDVLPTATRMEMAHTVVLVHLAVVAHPMVTARHHTVTILHLVDVVHHMVTALHPMVVLVHLVDAAQDMVTARHRMVTTPHLAVVAHTVVPALLVPTVVPMALLLHPTETAQDMVEVPALLVTVVVPMALLLHPTETAQDMVEALLPLVLTADMATMPSTAKLTTPLCLPLPPRAMVMLSQPLPQLPTRTLDMALRMVLVVRFSLPMELAEARAPPTAKWSARALASTRATMDRTSTETVHQARNAAHSKEASCVTGQGTPPTLSIVAIN